MSWSHGGFHRLSPLSTGLFAIHASSLVKCLCQSLPHVAEEESVLLLSVLMCQELLPMGPGSPSSRKCLASASRGDRHPTPVGLMGAGRRRVSRPPNSWPYCLRSPIPHLPPSQDLACGHRIGHLAPMTTWLANSHPPASFLHN